MNSSSNLLVLGCNMDRTVGRLVAKHLKRSKANLFGRVPKESESGRGLQDQFGASRALSISMIHELFDEALKDHHRDFFLLTGYTVDMLVAKQIAHRCGKTQWCKSHCACGRIHGGP